MPRKPAAADKPMTNRERQARWRSRQNESLERLRAALLSVLKSRTLGEAQGAARKALDMPP